MQKILLILLLIFSMGSKPVELENHYMKADQAISEVLAGVPNHRLMKSPEKRIRIAKALVDGAYQSRLPWELVVSIAFFESSFKPESFSKDGCNSEGLMQLHGAAKTYCQEELKRKIDWRSPEDQSICGSIWLRHSIDICEGEIRKGIARYATGYMCDYNHSKSLRFIVSRRMKLFEKIKNL